MCAQSSQTLSYLANPTGSKDILIYMHSIAKHSNSTKEWVKDSYSKKEIIQYEIIYYCWYLDYVIV